MNRRIASHFAVLHGLGLFAACDAWSCSYWHLMPAISYTRRVDLWGKLPVGPVPEPQSLLHSLNIWKPLKERFALAVKFFCRCSTCLPIQEWTSWNLLLISYMCIDP